jgi:hypothetical protein
MFRFPCFENGSKLAGLMTSPTTARAVLLVACADPNGAHINRAGCVGNETMKAE